MERDIIVVGGGPGGYVAAIRGAQLGAKVTLIEKNKIGGTCLNYGCIPTKTLYKNAELLNTLKHIEEFGINVDNYSFDIDKIQSRKNGVVEQLVGGIEQLLKVNNVEVINGSGKFLDKNTIKVTLNDGKEMDLNAKNIIIATGSRPFIPQMEGSNLEGVYTSREMLEFKEVPKRLVVIGGGVIGMEFAGIFNAMGSDVTVVEYANNILTQVDSDLSKRFVASLKKKGMKINTSTKVSKIEKDGSELVVTCEGKKGEITINADSVLLSTGRIPVIDGLNLDDIGICYNKKGIETDSNFMTNIEGVYAIGDVNGKTMLAHAASHQGITVVEHIYGKISHVNHDIVPSCIFVFPEIAVVGITEEDAKKKGIEYKSSKFLFGANGKALSIGEPDGFVKVIADMKDKILGVQIMGPHASDLIHEGTLAITKGLTVEDIANTIHAHPTLSEAFMEATLGLKGEAIHMVPTKNRK